MDLTEIQINHAKFKKSDDLIEKIEITAKNNLEVIRAAVNSFEELKSIAASIGYEINDRTGEVTKKK